MLRLQGEITWTGPPGEPCRWDADVSLQKKGVDILELTHEPR